MPIVRARPFEIPRPAFVGEAIGQPLVSDPAARDGIAAGLANRREEMAPCNAGRHGPKGSEGWDWPWLPGCGGTGNRLRAPPSHGRLQRVLSGMTVPLERRHSNWGVEASPMRLSSKIEECRYSPKVTPHVDPHPHYFTRPFKVVAIASPAAFTNSAPGGNGRSAPLFLSDWPSVSVPKVKVDRTRAMDRTTSAATITPAKATVDVAIEATSTETEAFRRTGGAVTDEAEATGKLALAEEPRLTGAVTT